MKYAIALIIVATILISSSTTIAVQCPTNSYDFRTYCTCPDGSKEYINQDEWQELRRDIHSCCYVPPTPSKIYQKKTTYPDGTFVINWGTKPLEETSEPQKVNPQDSQSSGEVRHEVIKDPSEIRRIELERARLEKQRVLSNQIRNDNINTPLGLLFLFLQL